MNNEILTITIKSHKITIFEKKLLIIFCFQLQKFHCSFIFVETFFDLEVAPVKTLLNGLGQNTEDNQLNFQLSKRPRRKRKHKRRKKVKKPKTSSQNLDIVEDFNKDAIRRNVGPKFADLKPNSTNSIVVNFPMTKHHFINFTSDSLGVVNLLNEQSQKIVDELESTLKNNKTSVSYQYKVIGSTHHNGQQGNSTSNSGKPPLLKFHKVSFNEVSSMNDTVFNFESGVRNLKPLKRPKKQSISTKHQFKVSNRPKKQVMIEPTGEGNGYEINLEIAEDFNKDAIRRNVGPKFADLKPNPIKGQ